MSKEQLTELFKQATANCMFFYQQQKNINFELVRESANNLQEVLERIWGELCRIYAAGNNEWEANSSIRGYLVRQTPTGKIQVPFHLADYFPTEKALEDLCSLALSVKISSNGVVCISGSSTFLRVLSYISDIDYCEYAPFNNNQGWQNEFVNALGQAIETQNEELICLQGKIFDAERNSTLVRQTQECRKAFDREIHSHVKLDFVTRYLEDVIEATNLVLLVDSTNPDDPTLERSFPLQEAPINEGDWVPQRLLNPLSLGHYATWLQQQVNYYQERDPIKATKRALSLSRITGFWEEADRIIQTLNDNTSAVRQATCQARRSLPKKLETLQSSNDSSHIQVFLKKLEETLNKLCEEKATSPESDNINTVFQEIFSNLLNSIEAQNKRVQSNVRISQ